MSYTLSGSYKSIIFTLGRYIMVNYINTQKNDDIEKFTAMYKVGRRVLCLFKAYKYNMPK